MKRNPIKEMNQKPMDEKATYKVRHIICPLCDKGFTEIFDDWGYTIDGREGYWEEVKCPKCETKLYVSEASEADVLIAEDTPGAHWRLVLR